MKSKKVIKKGDNFIYQQINKNNVEDFLLNKIHFFNDVIKKTLISCQKYNFWIYRYRYNFKYHWYQ